MSGEAKRSPMVNPRKKFEIKLMSLCIKLVAELEERRVAAAGLFLWIYGDQDIHGMPAQSTRNSPGDLVIRRSLFSSWIHNPIGILRDLLRAFWPHGYLDFLGSSGRRLGGVAVVARKT